MDIGGRADDKMQGRCRGIGLLAGAILGLMLPALAVGAGPTAETVPPLLGTAVEQGEDSYALFGSGDTFAWVKEGDEVATGLRLIRVYSDHATVRQEGTGQEIQVDLGIGGSFDGRPPPSPPPRAAIPSPGKYRAADVQSMAPQQLDRLNEEIKAQFERSRAADPSRGRLGGRRRGTQEGEPAEE